MEIVKKQKFGRAGNDCWISDYVMLIHLDSNLYTVILTETIYGSWTGDPKTTTGNTFTDYNEALSHYNSLVSKFERYV